MLKRHSAASSLPVLAQGQVPPLLFADNMALLATSPSGLQRQLQLLEQYCTKRGLTVIVKKTKIMLLAGEGRRQQFHERSGQASPMAVAQLPWGGRPLHSAAGRDSQRRQGSLMQ